MILDSSALVAIIFREEGHERLLAKLAASTQIAIGAPTLVESTIVTSARMERDAEELVSKLLREAGITVLPLTESHATSAVQAWWRYPAALNFGDCLAYAVAKRAGRPLLCCGKDFEKTDLALA